MSEDTAKLIDEEIRRIVTTGEKRAREALSANRDKLEIITQALMEFETLSGEEVHRLMRGEKIVRTTDDGKSKGMAGPAVPASGKIRPSRPEPGPGGLEPQPT